MQANSLFLMYQRIRVGVMFNIALLVVAISCNVASSVLLKLFSSNYQRGVGGPDLGSIFILFGAIALLMLTFMAYILLLRTWPLYAAYALITFSSQLALTLVSVFVFDEPVNGFSLAGMLLIFCGLGFMAIGNM